MFGAFGSLLIAARLLEENGGDNENGDFHVAMLTLFGQPSAGFFAAFACGSLILHLLLHVAWLAASDPARSLTFSANLLDADLIATPLGSCAK